MKQSRHKNIHWKYLAVLMGVFAIGTVADIAMQYFAGFSVGGTGANLAMIAAIILMYRYTGERFSFKSLVQMLRFVKPRFPTAWDKLAMAALVITAVITPFIVFNKSIYGDFSIISP